MLEDVERIALREDAVGKRQAAKIAEHQQAVVDRLRREIRAHVDADERRAASGVPDERLPAAAPEIDHEVVRRQPQEALEHAVPDARAEQRRRDMCVTGIGVQCLVEYFVCSVNIADGRRSRYADDGGHSRPHPAQRSPSAARTSVPRNRGTARWQSGDRKPLGEF